MLKTISTYLIFAVSIFNSGITYSQDTQVTREIDSLFRKAHRLGVFNGNVLIINNGKEIYKNAIGHADASENIALSQAYRFHIGSIAKEFNAVGIMMLSEQGKLNVNDKLSKYLPDLPPWADKVTIMNILNYTSGIPQSKWKEVKGDDDNMTKVKSMTALDFEPGTNYAYSNNDVFLQRRIIEKVTGMKFNSFVVEKMLKPSGINNGIVDPTATDKLVAKAFNDQRIDDSFVYFITGWTALDLKDFYKWSEAINSFKLINPASTRVLLSPFSLGNQTGLGRGNMQGDKIVSHIHDGTAGNYQALLVSEPQSATTIILLSNNKQNNLGSINTAIQSILSGKSYSQIKKSFLAGFQRELEKMTGREILALYERLKSEAAEKYYFEQSDLLNDVGYFLVRQKKLDDAILVFSHNVKIFPKEANLFDSLAEAYMLKGDKEKAVENLNIALKLDPALESSKAMLRELKK
jgi:CubicO group peptidase (beta-lactamase class C family)